MAKKKYGGKEDGMDVLWSTKKVGEMTKAWNE